MSLELLDTHLDTEAYEEMEQAVAPLERDADMRAHVEKALDDMVHDTVSNYGVNEQYSTELLFALPDLDTVPAASRSGSVVVWDLPGVIDYRGQRFTANYRVEGEIPGAHFKLSADQLIDDKLSHLLATRRKTQPDIGIQDIEKVERDYLPSYIKQVRANLYRIKMQNVSLIESSQKMRKRATSCDKQLAALQKRKVAATPAELLVALGSSYTEPQIAKLLTKPGNPLSDGWRALDNIERLSHIDNGRKHQSTYSTEDIARFTVTASIKDEQEAVGELKAVFGSTQPYLTKLAELRADEAQLQKIIENARAALFWEQQEALAYGERGAADPQAVVAAIDRVESPQTPVDADVIADEVDKYPNGRIQEFVKRYIHDALDDTAEYMSIIPDDTDTDALAGQATLLEYAKATTFEAPVRAIPTRKYAGEVVRLLGKDIPV